MPDFFCFPPLNRPASKYPNPRRWAHAHPGLPRSPEMKDCLIVSAIYFLLCANISRVSTITHCINAYLSTFRMRSSYDLYLICFVAILRGAHCACAVHMALSPHSPIAHCLVLPKSSTSPCEIIWVQYIGVRWTIFF